MPPNVSHGRFILCVQLINAQQPHARERYQVLPFAFSVLVDTKPSVSLGGRGPYIVDTAVKTGSHRDVWFVPHS